MKPTQLIITIALSILAAFFIGKYTSNSSDSSQNQAKESAFERVVRTGKLRCAYAVTGKPRFDQDPNTGKMLGTIPEIMEAIGRVLNLEIVWDEEVGYGVFTENLRGGKQDAFCSTVWTSSARAYKALMTAPVQHMPVYVYVRDGVTKYDNNIESMNNKDVSFSVMEGTTLDSIIKVSFPNATRHALPLGAGNTDTILDVTTGKADALVYDESVVSGYNKQNPDNKLRRVPSAKPIRIYGESFSVAMGEWKLREILNTAINELQNDGTIDRILRKHDTEYGKVLRSQGPYLPVKD